MAKPFSDLIKAVNKEPTRRTLQYQGETYEYFSTVLTMQQRENVKTTQKNKDDGNEFALKLLIDKALTKDGKRMFQPGQYAELKNEWPAQEVDAAMMLLLDSGSEEEEEQDPKA